MRLFENADMKNSNKKITIPDKKNELVSMALSLCEKPIIMKIPEDEFELNADRVTPLNNNSVVNLEQIENKNNNESSPSKFLNNELWKKSVSKCFKGIVRREFDVPIQESRLNDADKLVTILAYRLETHLNRRLPRESLKTHFSLS